MSTSNISAAQVKFAVINKTATGDLVAAVTEQKIRVTSYTLAASAAFTCTFTSGTGPTSITGPIPLAANGNLSSSGGFETAAGEKLAITLSGTGTVSGHITYQLV